MYPAVVVNPSISVTVVDPVAALYNDASAHAAPVQYCNVMSKLVNLALSIAEVNSICTAQTLLASVTTENAYVPVSPESNVG